VSPPDLSVRSEEPELIDARVRDRAALATMHDELVTINRYLGGRSSSLSILRRALAGRGEIAVPNARAAARGGIIVLDVGSGAGDLARAISAWGRRRGREIRVIGLDRNPQACRDAIARTAAGAEATSARASTAAAEVSLSFAAADAFRLPLRDGSVDIVHAALLLHHLSESDLATCLRELGRVARLGVVINDLHRHWLAWGAIAFLTRFFSRSVLIRHDAPLSVRRGFTRAELRRAFDAAGLEAVSIGWRWAFRYVAWAIARGGNGAR
jgi:ubiquinone/menaquinone biosynthesis C-methylase UbiE